MSRQNDQALRRTMFAIGATASVALSIFFSFMLWKSWTLDRLASGLGLHADPVTLGLVVAVVPIYFMAIETWFPIALADGDHVEVESDQAALARQHWNGVRITALLCILLTEVICDCLPNPVVPKASASAMGASK